MKMAVQDGIIEKYRSNYRLTSAGKAYAEGIFQQKKPSPIEVSVLISGDGGEARIISGTAKSDDQHIADAAKRITQEKLRENIPSKPLHIGDAYIKIIGKHEQVIANSFHHFFYVKTGHDLSKVIDDLPNDVKEEVMFVRKNADGHFFFEREYFL
jgi:hypothetical protein